MKNRTLFFKALSQICMLKDTETQDVRASYLNKYSRRKLETHLTGFNDTEVNRRYVDYPDNLEI